MHGFAGGTSGLPGDSAAAPHPGGRGAEGPARGSGVSRQSDSDEAALAALYGFMGDDLEFQDAALEAEYGREHADSQWQLDVMLAVLVRLPAWTATAIKVAARGQPRRAAFIWLTCTAASQLPTATLLASKKAYFRHRTLLLSACNTLQYLQSCWYYADLYSPRGTVDSVGVSHMLVVLLSANGVAYLLLTTFAGALTFRWAFLTQYAYLLILLVHNQQLCAASPALQAAYSMLHRALQPLADAVVGGAAALGWPQWPAATCAPTSLQQQCLAGEGNLWAEAAGGGFQRLQRTLRFRHEAGLLQTCVLWQATSQMLLGVALPCLLLFVRELRLRRDFVSRRLLIGVGRGPREPAASRQLLLRLHAQACLPCVGEYLVRAVPALLLLWHLLAFLPAAGSHA